ncbi:hypothetical protein BC829DRAFT_420847 [Chytridium lagenaria]|nr:hypothetical protein BC829DRAFT_420847 [Chytridium lagenaria]
MNHRLTNKADFQDAGLNAYSKQSVTDGSIAERAFGNISSHVNIGNTGNRTTRKGATKDDSCGMFRGGISAGDLACGGGKAHRNSSGAGSTGVKVLREGLRRETALGWLLWAEKTFGIKSGHNLGYN